MRQDLKQSYNKIGYLESQIKALHSIIKQKDKMIHILKNENAMLKNEDSISLPSIPGIPEATTAEYYMYKLQNTFETEPKWGSVKAIKTWIKI